MNREFLRGRAEDRAVVMPIRRPSKTRDYNCFPSEVYSYPGSDHFKIHDVYPPATSLISTRDGVIVRGKLEQRQVTKKSKTRNSKTPNAMEHRVSFAAQSFKVEGLSLDDYSEEECKAYWYTKKELRSLRNQHYAKSNDILSNRSKSPPYASVGRRWSA